MGERKLMRLFLAMLLLAGLAAAQSPDSKTLGGDAHWLFQVASGNVLKAAEKMPEEFYSFKPVDTVKTFGEIAGHVADAQYFFCGSINADGKQAPGIEKKKSKAEIVAGLKAAFAYCEAAYKATTSDNATTGVKFLNADHTRLGVLNFNSVHVYEHYGNLVTYMRIKGIVPPSSEGR